MQLRSIATTNTVRLARWAHKYDRFGPYPCDQVVRYGIGTYQIAQGMKWEGRNGRGP